MNIHANRYCAGENGENQLLKMMHWASNVCDLASRASRMLRNIPLWLHYFIEISYVYEEIAAKIR
jgi:hypothetical protein